MHANTSVAASTQEAETETAKLVSELFDSPHAARMADGTGIPGDDHRAQCAHRSLQTMHRREEAAWRDIVWAQLAAAITETDPVRLRTALVPVVDTTGKWIAALDQRITEDQPTD